MQYLILTPLLAGICFAKPLGPRTTQTTFSWKPTGTESVATFTFSDASSTTVATFTFPQRRELPTRVHEVLHVSESHQEEKPTEKSVHREAKPSGTERLPSESHRVEKPIGTAPHHATKLSGVEHVASGSHHVEKPAETKPHEEKPVETKPHEEKPAETKAHESKPSGHEHLPSESRHLEKPAETKAHEAKPTVHAHVASESHHEKPAETSTHPKPHAKPSLSVPHEHEAVSLHQRQADSTTWTESFTWTTPTDLPIVNPVNRRQDTTFTYTGASTTRVFTFTSPTGTGGFSAFSLTGTAGTTGFPFRRAESTVTNGEGTYTYSPSSTQLDKRATTTAPTPSAFPSNAVDSCPDACDAADVQCSSLLATYSAAATVCATWFSRCQDICATATAIPTA